MRSTELAVHEVRATEDGRLVTQHGEFDAASYSRMKHGHTIPAREYGYQLAELLTAADDRMLSDRDVSLVVYGPATRCTPKRAQAIAFYFTQSLNHRRAHRDLHPAQMHDMKHVQQGEPVPYAALGRAERRAAMAHTIDYADPNIVNHACVICIDDLKLTGSVEAKMTETLAPLHPTEIHYLYAVRLDPAFVTSDPMVEDRINTAATPSPAAIAQFIEQGEFLLNDRVVRMLLTWPDRSQIHALLNGQNDLFLEQLLNEIAAAGALYYRLSIHLVECLQEIMEKRRHPLLPPVRDARHGRMSGWGRRHVWKTPPVPSPRSSAGDRTSADLR